LRAIDVLFKIAHIMVEGEMGQAAPLRVMLRKIERDDAGDFILTYQEKIEAKRLLSIVMNRPDFHDATAMQGAMLQNQ